MQQIKVEIPEHWLTGLDWQPTMLEEIIEARARGIEPTFTDVTVQEELGVGLDE